MSRRADAVYGPQGHPTRGSEPRSGVSPASMHRNYWPHKSYLELGALPTAVPCARLHARHVMWEWGLNEQLVGTVELLTSELVTNAMKATHGRGITMPIRMRLSTDNVRVLIEVWDADPRPPKPTALHAGELPDFDTEGGRGLFLVAMLSERWSWYATPELSGKVVWAEVAP